MPCTISILGSSKETVAASYNPKEVSIDKSVPWQKHEKSKGDVPDYEFTSAEGRNLSVELFFDTYETGKNVADTIAKLEKGTLIMEGGKEEDRHPPTCIFVWGSFPSFKGVIESLSVKYTMFFADGTPCRASASLKMKEANEVAAKVERQQAGSGGGGGDSSSSNQTSSTPGSGQGQADPRGGDRSG